jgi:hypothetical protein
LLNTASNSPSNESTPVTLIKPSLAAYFQIAGKKLDQETTRSFVLLGKSAQTVVAVSGDTGELSNFQRATGELGKLIAVRGHGAESSQCDAGSGRTISQASAQALVSAFNVNGLRFEYSVAAQGGHYRTAVSCLGTLPVGLTGHDTSAQAHVEITGVLDFNVGGTALSIDWSGMPQNGAAFKLTKDGQSFSGQSIRESGHLNLKLQTPGKYQLVTSVSVDLQNRGSCCGQTESASATITLEAANETLGQQ